MDTLPVEQPSPAVEATRRELSWQIPAAALLAAALAGCWLVLAPRSPDLAAQSYRVGLFSHLGMTVFDLRWYGGHYMPGYSLLFPPLAAWIGLRLLGVLAVVASAAIFAAIARAVYGPRTAVASLWFAAAAVGGLWIGRLSFALGVTFALAAVLLLVRADTAPRARGSVACAALMAALSAATSPVAGLLLALAGVTDMLVRRRLRVGLTLIVPVLVVVAPLEALFGDGGYEPYGAKSFIAATAVALAFVWALPRRQRLLAAGGWLFVAASVLCVLVRTPMGSNLTRYAVLLAGPLLLCALARDGGLLHGDRRPPWATLAVLAGIASWVVWGPVTQTEIALKESDTQASYYLPVRRFLAAHTRGPVRIEVPFTRSHWEAALLAPYVSLAGGWERQLDKRYNAAIEADPLSAGAYRRWLRSNAVSYVALPEAPLDGSRSGEAAVIRSEPPFLREVARSAHWRIYRVLGSRPLVEAIAPSGRPARLIALGHDSFTLRAPARGRFLVRVRYTPYWTVVAGSGRVSPGREGWTEVTAGRAGALRVEAVF